MTDRTLTERLAAARDRQTPRAASADRAAAVASVLANLGDVLNSRAGCAETRPDLGVPDFNDLVGQFPDAIHIIARAVKAQIERFEPRLNAVSVRHVEDPDNPLNLVFEIHAALRLGEESSRLTFETVLGDDGFLKVRS
jgi:type VI secretion system protein